MTAPFVLVKGFNQQVSHDTHTERATSMTDDTSAKTPVRVKQLETVMRSVERFLMNGPRNRSESTRDRVNRMMDKAEQIRAILETEMVKKDAASGE